MLEVPKPVLDKLDLRAAALNEASLWRNLVPPEPAWPLVAANPGAFAGIVASRLRSGAVNSTAAVSYARKAHQGVRPVPIVGLIERIALRALTDWVLADIPEPARDGDAYRAFVAGPIKAAFTVPGRIGYRLIDAEVEYVIQADIAAFYQYVDHGLLLNELESRTEKFEASRLLVSLLNEVQGLNYGLPQLFDASDRLSDVYIEILERELVRRQIKLWRYNDDFRFIVNGYGKAQQTLEQLSVSAHRLGLILNESKTSILKFNTYFWRHMGTSSEAEEDEFNPAEVQVWDSDYPDLEPQDLIVNATSTFARLDLAESEEGTIDLLNPGLDGVRALRHALAVAAKAPSDIGLTRVRAIIEYVPELTPRACDYLIALHNASVVEIGSTWDELAAMAPKLNAWQRCWLVYTGRACSLFFDQGRREWVSQQRDQSEGGLLHAECSLALAMVDGISFEVLDEALRTQPDALAPWYVLGIKALTGVDPKLVTAVKNSAPLYRVLLEGTS